MGKGRLELPRLLRHMILSHACLPVPALPHEAELDTNPNLQKVNQFSEKSANSMLTDFLNSRRQGLSGHTLLFYQRCLSKAIGIELNTQETNDVQR